MPAPTYVLQQDTGLGRGQCHLWWIFPNLWAVTSGTEDCNLVDRSRDRKSRIMGFLLTQEKDTEVLSALLWSCVSLLKCRAYGLPLHPVSILLGVSVMEVNMIAYP